MSTDSSYLLSRQFKRMHGMTVEQGLSGHIANSGQVFTPAEWKAHHEGTQYGRRFDPEAHMRHVRGISVSPQDAAKDWMMNHMSFLVGDDYHVAKRVETITNMLRSGSTNTMPLYRGSRKPLSEEAGFNSPLSFTTDPYVAKSFAAKGGKIHKLQPGSVRGVFIPELVNRQRTVGSGWRPESEFLVDPESLK